jgi:hypothetical protein
MLYNIKDMNGEHWIIFESPVYYNQWWENEKEGLYELIGGEN